MSSNVESFLLQEGAVSERLSSALKEAVAGPLDALVLYSLGEDHSCLVEAVKACGVKSPVYLSETYGIVGYDIALGRNVELMEKDRGKEYGCVGGSGGKGVVVVAYKGGFLASHDEFPKEGVSCTLAVVDGSKSNELRSLPCLYYGGVSKANYVLTETGSLSKIPSFYVFSKNDAPPIGIASVQSEDIGAAYDSLIKKCPNGVKTTPSVGLFPCYTRGINSYGRENVEPDALQERGCRVYGMFAHGELGPDGDAASGIYVPTAQKSACTKHSETSVLVVHTA